MADSGRITAYVGGSLLEEFRGCAPDDYNFSQDVRQLLRARMAEWAAARAAEAAPAG